MKPESTLMHRSIEVRYFRPHPYFVSVMWMRYAAAQAVVLSIAWHCLN